MATKGVIGIRGLKTSGNELAFPAGSLTQAEGIMYPSQGVAQQARGLAVAGYIDNDSSDAGGRRAREFWQWDTNLFISMVNALDVYALALWEDWADTQVYHGLGAFRPPEPATLRMKFAALAQSAYFTTDAGLYGVDKPSNTPLAAGVQRPKDFLVSDNDGGIGTRLNGNPDASGSWLSKNNAVAYRAVIGRKDSNSVVKLSEPNGRLVVINPPDLVVPNGDVQLTANVVTVGTNADGTNGFRTGDIVGAASTDGEIGTGPYTFTSVTSNTLIYAKTAANHTSSAAVTYSSGFKAVQVNIPLSAEAVAGWFVQLYRTDESAGASIDPGDECFLCYERLLSATDISNGYVLITDTTPSAFLGAPLATNENSGDGPAAGANDKPPLLRDVTTWDSRLFGIQMLDRHRLVFRALGCGAPSGLQNNDVIAVNTRTYIVGDSTVSPRDFELTTWQLPSQNILSTCRSISGVLGAQQPGCASRFEYDGTSPTGEVLVDELGLGAGGFADASSGAIDGIYAATTRTSAFADSLALLKAVTSANTARTGGNTVTVRCPSHGFVLGQQVMLAYSHNIGVDTHFPPGLKTVASVVDANNFTYTETGTNATMSGTYYAYATTFKSDHGVECIRFSKAGEPDAWPLPNVLGGLPDGASPLRVKPTSTGNALMVFLKNGAIFRVSGEYPYVVRPFDDTAQLVAADSLVGHNSQLEALTTQGIVTIGNGGVGVVGRDVEEDTRTILNDISAGMSPSNIFGLSYESDRQYQIWYGNQANPTPGVALVHASMDSTFSALSENVICGLVFKGWDQALYGSWETNEILAERKAQGTTLFRSFAGKIVHVIVSGTQTGVSTIAVDDGTLVFAGAAILISGTEYLITGVAGNNLTINGTVTVVDDASLRCDLPVTSILAFAMEAAGIPGVEKSFRELQLHFAHRLFRRLVVNFSNEKTSTAVPVTVQPDDYVYGQPITRNTIVRVDVPRDLQRSALLKVSLTLVEAFSYYRLLGYSATSEASSEKTGK